MKKQTQKPLTVTQAFTAWMKGEPFLALAKLVRPKLHQADFKKIAGVERWTQAVAKRDRAVKQAQKRGAA